MTPEPKFEEALLAYGKASQDFQVRRKTFEELKEMLSAVCAAHARELAAAREEGKQEAYRWAASFCRGYGQPSAAEEFERRAAGDGK